jgi:hypothetical protein
MGELDSSRTRVAPIFTSLWALQGRRPSWLADLLELPEIDGEHPGAQLPPPGAVRRYGWGRAEEGCPGELALPAPPALLRWLVLHLDPSRIPTVRPAIDEPREALAAGDHNRCMEALRHLDEGTQPAEGAWHILEGPTFPDVYLETDDLVVVVEGKRTERGPTRDTTFMPVRDQLLRHMDAALGYAGRSRRVVGFYAVEGDPPMIRQYPKNGVQPFGERSARTSSARAFLIAPAGTERRSPKGSSVPSPGSASVRCSGSPSRRSAWDRPGRTASGVPGAPLSARGESPDGGLAISGG